MHETSPMHESSSFAQTEPALQRASTYSLFMPRVRPPVSWSATEIAARSATQSGTPHQTGPGRSAQQHSNKAAAAATHAGNASASQCVIAATHNFANKASTVPTRPSANDKQTDQRRAKHATSRTERARVRLDPVLDDLDCVVVLLALRVTHAAKHVSQSEGARLLRKEQGRSTAMEK